MEVEVVGLRQDLVAKFTLQTTSLLELKINVEHQFYFKISQ
jgi:hypothetical protein